MTTSRVIRGTRAKIFLYICGVLIITGIIACYNNTLSQLDDIRRANEICHQQEENLSTQLQVISDYKQRLEKSLKTEKAEHQQTKINLENKLNEERNKNEKSFDDVKIKLSSLQQHFNLLQTEYDDYKEECGKTQQKQQEEINDLQAKLEEVKEELKKVKSSKESLKTQYLELEAQKEDIEKQFKENQNSKNDNESNINLLTKENIELRRELDALKAKCLGQDTLQAPKVMDINSPKSPSKATPSTENNNNIMNKPDIFKPPPVEKQEKMVLAEPSDSAKMASSKSTTKSGIKPSVGSLNGARPLLIPTVTPGSVAKNNKPKSSRLDKKLPAGVVDFPQKKEDVNEQPEIINNRYQNVKESANEHVEKVAKEDIEKEDGANEEFDGPLPLDGLAFGENDHIKHAEKQNFDKKHIDALGGVNEKDRKNYDQEQQEYKDLQNDVQLEENEEDDDADGYDDHLALARQKEPAVRN